MFKPRNLLFVGLAVVMVLGLASLASAQGAATVQTATNPTLGSIITDGQGKTLYIFTRDTPGVSNCTGQCAQSWPPLTVTAGTTPTAGQGATGTLGTITRQDGTTQITYNQMPLYYFGADQAAGDTKGHGVGNVWFVVNPTSGPVMAGTTTTAGATATSSAPSVLPTTGGEIPIGIMLAMAAGILMLLGAVGVNLARRPR